MSAIHWFEIPATDIERAAKFYSEILEAEMPILDLVEQMGSILSLFPANDGVGGALVQNSQLGYVPAQAGTLIYLALGYRDLNTHLEKVEPAGGKVLLSKTAMGENGFSAWIEDTEGNKVGLHSNL